MAGVDDASTHIAPVTPFGDLQSILDLVKGVTGTSSNSSTTQNLGPEAQGALQLFLQHFLPTLNHDYSPEAATRDSEGLVKQIFDTYKTGDLPKIYAAEKNSGGYNSTTGQGLADNAFAQAVAKSADVTSKTKDNYAQREQSQMNSLLQLVLGLGAVTKNSTTTGTQGGLSNDALKKAAAAAALAAAAKKASGSSQPPKGGQGGGPQTKEQAADAAKEINKQLNEQEPYDEPTSQESADKVQQDILDSLQGSPGGGSSLDSILPPSEYNPDDSGIQQDILDSVNGSGDIGGFGDFNFSDIFGDTGDDSDFNFDFEGGGIDYGGIDGEDSF